MLETGVNFPGERKGGNSEGKQDHTRMGDQERRMLIGGRNSMDKPLQNILRGYKKVKERVKK